MGAWLALRFVLRFSSCIRRSVAVGCVAHALGTLDGWSHGVFDHELDLVVLCRCTTVGGCATPNVWLGRPEALPRAHTCFNQLLLPSYESKDKLRSKLSYAMLNTKGFQFA